MAFILGYILVGALRKSRAHFLKRSAPVGARFCLTKCIPVIPNTFRNYLLLLFCAMLPLYCAFPNLPRVPLIEKSALEKLKKYQSRRYHFSLLIRKVLIASILKMNYQYSFGLFKHMVGIKTPSHVTSYSDI